MIYKITLIPGDGIGPEITEATRRVLDATGVNFHWDLAYVGSSAQDRWGTPLPDSVFGSIRKNKVALKGPVTTPVGSGFRSVNVALRQGLDLYACLRPCKTYPGAPSLYKNVNIVIVRENMEDLYSGIEFERGTPEASEPTWYDVISRDVVTKFEGFAGEHLYRLSRVGDFTPDSSGSSSSWTCKIYKSLGVTHSTFKISISRRQATFPIPQHPLVQAKASPTPRW